MTISTIERSNRGVRYTVEHNGMLIFNQFIRFGMDRRHRAGGGAFIEAAHAQDAAAREALAGVPSAHQPTPGGKPAAKGATE